MNETGKKTRVVLSFPPAEVEEPITYHLIRDCGLMVNILRATIDPGKEGRMVVDLSGVERDLTRGFDYLETAGVKVEPLAEEMEHNKDSCVGCTACVPICPTGSLRVDRESWEVSYEPDKCVVCLSCVDACPYRAMAVHLD